MAEEGSIKEELVIKEELQGTDFGEEYIESTRTPILPDVFRVDGTASSSNMKEEQNNETSEFHGIDTFLEVQIKEEPRDDASPSDLRAYDATNDPLSSPMPSSPVPGSFYSPTGCSANLSTSVEEQTCTVSDAVFASPAHLVDHAKNLCTNNMGPREQSDKESSLAMNQTVYSEKKPYACDKCYLRFSGNDALAMHKTMHGGKKTHTCNICEASFSLASSLESHKMNDHPGETPYACDICEARFMIYSQVIEHKITYHLGDKIYACDICEAKFSARKLLIAHTRAHHSGEDFKRYTCDICKAKFKFISKLITHKKCHTRATFHPCDMCPARFRSNIQLVKHKSASHQIITNNKSHTCDICPARFKFNSQLVTHRLSHSGVKLYACDICLSLFNSNTSLNRHKRSHSERKANSYE